MITVMRLNVGVPTGTMVVICVSDTTVKLASMPANLIDVVGVKYEPVMVTKVPVFP